MITAFQVYLVMQLDSINVMFIIAAVCSGIALCISLLVTCVTLDDRDGTSDLAWKFFKKCLPVTIICLVAQALIPSTKTAAAMIVLPAITSKDVLDPIGAEAKELYVLAKQALADAVNKTPEKEPEKK